MNEPKATVLPIYLVADESGSMLPVVAQLNSGLTSLLDALHMEAFAASKVRLAIVGFAAMAKLHLPMSDLRQLGQLPTLGASGGTSYASAFRKLRELIPNDVAALKAEQYLVNRPAVFFLTDGAPDPNEDWRTPLAALRDPNFRERPNILAFGIGEADPSVINQIASKEEFGLITTQGYDTGKALADFCVTLTQSIINSAQNAGNGSVNLQVERPQGFTVAADLM